MVSYDSDACEMQISVKSFASHEEVAAWRKSTEDEVQKHKHAISNLWSQFNARLPVSRLPPEVLTKIFIMHRDFAKYPGGAKLGHPRYWIAISHVCRHWRTVALNYPTLWTYIDFNFDLTCLSEVFVRAKQAPRLNILTKGLSRDKRPIFLRVLEEMPRISELEIDLPSNLILKRVGSAPLLQKLILDACDNSELEPFFGILCGDEAPLLQYLVLKTWKAFVWPTNVSHPNLKEFHLSSHDHPESLIDIFAALDGMPLLEKLVLDYACLPHDLQPSTPGDRVITLPHLRYIEFRFHAGMKGCVNFLNYLRLPFIHNIFIDSFSTDLLSDLNLAKIHHISGLQYALLSFTNPKINIALATEASIDYSSSLTLNFGGRCSRAGLLNQINEAACKALPFPEVNWLTIKGKVHEEMLRSALEHWDLRHLRVLTIHAKDCYSVLEVLCLRRGTGSNAAFLPNLETLRFVECDFPAQNSQRDRIYKLNEECVNEEFKPGFERRCKAKKILYFECTGLNASLANIIRSITGATDDNFCGISGRKIV